MRIWDLPVQYLCRKHLLGEHVELHIMWNTLTNTNAKGWHNHPETLRWKDKTAALWLRHWEQWHEMIARGYEHKSMLDYSLISNYNYQPQNVLLLSLEDQKLLLKKKGCLCGNEDSK